MREAVWKLLESGGTLLCANAHAARTWMEAWDQAQVAVESAAWERPRIFSLGAWLESHSAFAVLRPEQELWLWEATTPNRDVDDAAGAARLAASGWELAQAWRLPAAGLEWKESGATEAYHAWTKSFRDRCRDGEWSSAAELPDLLAEGFRQGRLQVPSRVGLLGFDRLTPQQADLLAALRQAGSLVEEVHATREPAPLACWKAPDADQELRAAARWAWERRTKAPVGVVVPDLAARRAQVEEIFAETFHPLHLPGREAPADFHLSLGPALAWHPMVESALALLDWQAGGSHRAGPGYALLRSPWLGWAERDRDSRARKEARLRRAQHEFLDYGDLAAARLPLAAPDWGESRRFSAWALAFSQALQAAGWPGERALDSAEFQALEAWQGACVSLAQLDQVAAEPVSARVALGWLRRITQRPFQPRATAASVQVMGWLEAAGLEFAHLWICGLSDNALPQPPNPHPFLPFAWQRNLGLPRATAAQEADFAARVFERLRRSTADLVASYPGQEGDAGLRPSPLLAGARVLESAPVAPAPPISSAEFETVDDTHGPAVGSQESTPGGSGILKAQAVCQFQAFATYRLQARPLEDVPSGLPATVRGDLLHKALHLIWDRLKSLETLQNTDGDTVRSWLREIADSVVANEPVLAHRPTLARLEAARLAWQVQQWLINRERIRSAGFTVVATEAVHEAVLAGLRLRLRVDRVDEMQAGGRVLVDYKSGETKKTYWNPPRPWEPQLPLYLITQPDPEGFAGIAFAQLKPGDMGLKAEVRRAGLIAHAAVPADWAQRCQEWRLELTSLAAAFMAGEASILPKEPRKDSCGYCRLQILCRIGPREAGEEEGGDAD